MITVIGLGVEQGDLTKRGEEIIISAAKTGRKIVVRTANTKSYQTVLARKTLAYRKNRGQP